MSIIIQSITAFAAALVSSFFGGLTLLISVSVFFMAIAYFATCASVFGLQKKDPAPNTKYGKKQMIIPVLGIIFSAYLISQCTLIQIGIGALLLLVGIPIYIKYSPKKELTEVKQAFVSKPNIFRRVYDQEHVFLANLFHHIKKIYKRLRKKPEENAIP